jgi:hypothetical protein
MKWFTAFWGITAFFLCSIPLQALSADITPPNTSINPYSYSTDQTYPSSLTVSLSCYDYYDSGCAGTFYCLGTACQPTTPYLGNQIRIVESTVLRYYSVDKASNAEAVKTQNYTILAPDKVPPVVTGFVAPPSYTSLTFPVTLFASDNIAVSAYCLTETNDPGACTWSASAPGSFTVTGPGTHTLYAFARDAAGNVSAPATATVREPKNFIRAPQAVDFVYSAARDTLYIASGASILRYQIASRNFLPPYQPGGKLTGIDLSPDGGTLAAADESRTALYLVKLSDDTVVQKAFAPSGNETGIHSVAFGADGSLLVASKTSDGSSSPLRRYDPATGALTVLENLTGATLASGAGARCLALGESNYSGSLASYDVASQKITWKVTPYSGSQEIGVSRDCSQLAGAGYFWSNATAMDAYFPSTVGLAYHPGADLVYLATGTAGSVLAYDTKNFSLAAAYDAGSSFRQGGHLRISSDGALLFALADQGIGIIDLSVPAALSQSLTVNHGTPAPVRLSAVTPLNSPLSYQVTAAPLHGTLSGTAPNLTYTSAPSYEGADSFTFAARNGQGESGVGTISFTVARDAIPPVISSFSLPATSSALVVPISSFAATDSAGVTGYCLSLANSSQNCTWTGTPPSSFDFSNLYIPYRPQTLFAFARDAAGNVSPSASATVSLAKTGANPDIPALVVPSLSESLTIWVSPPATAGGDIRYCLTESSDPATCSSWSQFPNPYTFNSYGPHTLYGFAINAGGNISAPSVSTVTIIGKRGDEIAGSYLQVAYEPTRQILYLLQANMVLRFHLPSQSFLSPYLTGKSLGGVAVSPNGTTLVAGNAAGVGIFLVDLGSDAVTEVSFSAAANEPATTLVAFGSDGAVVAAGRSSSGSAPLRRYDPVTGAVSIVATIPSGWYSSFSPGPGGQCIGLYDGNGHDSIYQVQQQSVTPFLNIYGPVYPNRDCSRFATESTGSFSFNNSLDIYNATLGWNGSLAVTPYGIAYDPQKDVVYLLNGGSLLKAYDGTTFAEQASYQMKGTSALPGQSQGYVPLLVSGDGSLLFALFRDGVGYLRLTGAVADNQALSLVGGSATAVTLTGRSSRAATLSYRVVTPPSHGTLTGTAPHLLYTPDPGFLGQDRIAFTVNDGTEESAAGTLTIAISAVQTAPPSAYLTVPYQSSSREVPVSVDVYGYPAPVGPLSWCLSESASAASCSWSPSAPQHYTFGGDFPQAIPVTRQLYAFVRDGTGKVSLPSSPGPVVITMPDSSAPVVVAFVLPASYPGLTVPFGLVGGDNGSVSFYCLTELDNSASCQWQWYYGNQLFNVTLGNYGLHTLYAFVRDAAGNVSQAASASVLPVRMPTWTLLPQPSFFSCENSAFSIAADGYPVPALSISGTLPAGIVFTPNSDGTATLSGSAHAESAGVHLVTVTADIGMGYTASQELIVTVAKGARFELAAAISGSGAGSLNSYPAGLTCMGGKCLGCYDENAAVTVFATPGGGSRFGTWGGACSGSGACQVAMTDNEGLTATFVRSNLVKVDTPIPGYYGTLQSACSDAPDGATLLAQALTFVEDVTIQHPVVIKGGFDPDFAGHPALTVLNGVLIIRDGRLTVDGLVLR